MKRRGPTITAERLRQLLDYDPATGLFTRKVAAGRNPAGSLAGCRNSLGYVQIMIDQRNYSGQRLAWLFMTGEWPVEDVDHVNSNRSDNSWSNLRAASRSENLRNMKVRRAGLKGVRRVPNGKWAGQARYQGRPVHLGTFNTEAEAHLAYVQFAADKFGEFARAA